jgi:hypothetical protein
MQAHPLCVKSDDQSIDAHPSTYDASPACRRADLIADGHVIETRALNAQRTNLVTFLVTLRAIA